MDPAPDDSDDNDAYEDQQFMLWQSFKAHQKRMREAGRSDYGYEDDEQEQHQDQEEEAEPRRAKEQDYLRWEGEEPDIVPDVYTELVDPSETQLDAW